MEKKNMFEIPEAIIIELSLEDIITESVEWYGGQPGDHDND